MLRTCSRSAGLGQEHACVAQGGTGGQRARCGAHGCPGPPWRCAAAPIAAPRRSPRTRCAGDADRDRGGVERPATGAACPGCGRWAVNRHDRRRQKGNEPLADRQVTLVVVRRQFRCLLCNRAFPEPEEGWGPRRLTRRLWMRLGREGGQQSVQQVAPAARTWGEPQARTRTQTFRPRPEHTASRGATARAISMPVSCVPGLLRYWTSPGAQPPLPPGTLRTPQ
jgi:hypothetical protein